MSLAVRVLDEQDFARADPSRLTVARGDLDARVEVDDVLAARSGMPVQIVVRLNLAEDDAGGRHPLREPAGLGRLGVLDLDVLKVRLAVLVRVEPMDLHEGLLLLGASMIVTGVPRGKPARLYSRKWPRSRRSVSSGSRAAPGNARDGPAARA